MHIIKYLGYTVLWVILLALILVRWLFLYQWFAHTDAKIVSTYEQYFGRVELWYMMIQDKEVRYLDVWDISRPLILVVHWAPGDLTGARRVITDPRIRDRYRFVLVDRVGYGRSETGRSLESIQQHSDIYMQLLGSVADPDQDLPLVVWHSYGATIAMKMIMDHSDQLAGAIVVSGALDSSLEKVFAISHLIKYQPFKFLSGPMFWVTNDEKLSHVQSLETEVQNYQDIQKPVTVIHGTHDSIVPYGNFAYMQERVPTPYFNGVTLTWANHALHITDPVVFVDAILDFYN